jgi:hypothetical protein
VVSLANQDGYYWSVSDSGKLGKPVSDNLQAQGVPSPPSRAAFIWETKGKVGTYKLSLVQQIPWPERTAPRARFSFTVNIAKAGQGLNQRCGGFSNLSCAPGFECVTIQPPPWVASDLSGVCKVQGAPLGATCAGIQGTRCASGLVCLGNSGVVETGIADGVGTCTAFINCMAVPTCGAGEVEVTDKKVCLVGAKCVTYSVCGNSVVCTKK